ncbi:ATP-binding protein [Moritella sp. Urea-trap-13]|uniref:ATP-binding response regulator n=1 Tax=Moritella sp. Urea-trap-13 TaxID=2058327 RepID=UPI000C33252C|nr:ATP-binding protein [Moritella sp. Urea-trap-13]PKH04840.1 hybrid sensor histidine kinase/response regulator [Moritella sp. Urea-trap-13]
MSSKFNLRSYVCACLLVTMAIVAVFSSYSLSKFKSNHDKNVATLMALNEENYLQHRLIMNATKSFFKASQGVKESEFRIFTRELLGKREAIFFTLTPELTLGYISDDSVTEHLNGLEVNIDKDGMVKGTLPHYQLIGFAIDEPNMPYLFYAVPIKNVLFSLDKLKGSCLKYSSSQLSAESKNCVLKSTNMLFDLFRYESDLDISIPNYNFYYILTIKSQVSESRLMEFFFIVLSILVACALVFVLLYFRLVNKHLFNRIERENKLNVAMVSSINHEIRTPINALLGYSQMLRDMPKISDEHSVVIDKMLWSANLLYSVAENTLNYSKSATDGLVLNNAPINTPKYFNNIKDYYNKLSLPEGKTLDFHVSDKLPKTISVDSSKLFQVITNMINNALKYSTGQAVSCHVDICLRRVFNDPTSSNRELYLRVLIQDTGRGMSQSTKELLTDPFVFDSESQLKKVSGIGLGLYTCNQLLAQIGGKLRLHSVENEGTKIMLHFPLRCGTYVLSEPLNPRNYADKRILIVDDNSFNLEVCNAMLEDEQFNTVCADNSEDALINFTDTNPDLVIVDYQLDEINGIDLITKMKSIQGDAKTQYFILSANDKNEILHSECHPDIYFMQKPFNTAIFLSCLENRD